VGAFPTLSVEMTEEGEVFWKLKEADVGEAIRARIPSEM